MPDAIDALEEDANRRQRSGKRQQSTPRNPRKLPTEEELQAREEERQRRRSSEEGQKEPAATSAASGSTPEADAAERNDDQGDEPNADEAPAKKRPRPASQTWYPEEDNEEFLWQVAQEATARREKVPATAVIRLALRRLEDQMTPAKIVQELGGSVQTQGKRGRPRR
ncbi:hypothetical protein [Streptomyces chryseus]|uniref:hypothetical protein n=1 Tax=Streptomyces chryseus TaxID=68186 RepID=UPI00110FD523|nr:hypothetical protein [Streptomyces chryseus]GGX36671.1 hypothetical protein GCM10010353_59770 [Streptomyces chryseus]